MDLTTVTHYRKASTRADLTLHEGEAFVAGGTWVFSEPNRHLTGLVDISAMPWEPWEVTPAGLRIGATCTIAQLLALPHQLGWHAQPLFAEAANALLAGFKIWNEATVVGNLCRAYSAAAMVAACVALDGSAEIWTPDGGQRSMPVADIPTGNGSNVLKHGELVRAIDIPAAALAGRTALRKIALADHGRSGAVAIARLDPSGQTTITITAATLTPQVIRYRQPPHPAQLRADCEATGGFYTDPLGSADWRQHVAGSLAVEALSEVLE
jgi:CO/xanthine dehydrogenase FAD-binding subunit